MKEDILEIKNLSIRKRNKKDSLVDSVNISVKKGEVVALVGESGAGKSITSLSILKLLYQGLGLEVNGEICLALNNDLINLSQSDKEQINQIRKEKIGMVFQEPQTALNPVLTCGKQVSEAVLNTDRLSIFKKLLYGLSNRLENILFKILNKEIIIFKKSSFNITKQKVLFWFEKLNIEHPLLTYNKYPHELSGGQKQRVIIAMALIKDPILLIADEPTTALDKFTQDILMHDLKKLQKENSLSILFVSHDLNLVKSIADRIYIMKDGRIIESGNIEDIFQKPKHLYTRDLIASCPPKDKKLSELPTRKHFMGFDDEGYFGDVNLSLEKLINKMTISPAESIKCSEKLTLNQPIIKVNSVYKKFKSKKDAVKHKALENISFQVHKGETLGIIGESGSGKSTLGKVILGILPLDKGEIIFKEKNIHQLNKNEFSSFRKAVQIVFQDPYSSLNPSKTIRDILIEPLKVYKISSKQNREDDIKNLLKQVGLVPDTKFKYPHELSGGQRQRVCIARALAVNPEIIVFDESVSALDVSVKADILNLLNELKKQLNLTYLFISHDLSVIRFISDRVMVMKNSQLVELGFTEEIFNSPKEEYTKKLLISDS